MTVRDPDAALAADIASAPADTLAARVAETRAAAVVAIDGLPDGPCRMAMLAWLDSVDADAAAELRRPALAYGRVWLAAQSAYRPPSETAPTVQETPRPAPPVKPPAEPEVYIGDPRDGRPVSTSRPVTGVRLPPIVRTAAPKPAQPVEPRRVPQGRPPYVPMRDRPSPQPHRPLGPAPDDDDIPF